jgi:hypothetical protein
MIANANTVTQPITAAILTYVSKLWAGEADPLWPHVVLLSLAVLASIAVGFCEVFERALSENRACRADGRLHIRLPR